jgi:UDP-N-acetylglucosamine--N-acetylmuramyl-(pentapeptide) pyrophosphoryl-undecaprenol N-acetylglucosamine transferase
MARAPVVIAAGGTGGHFFPAEACAAALMARGERVVLMTDARSGGLASPVFADTERYVLAGAGLSGRNLFRALQGALLLAQGVWQARRILRRVRPGALVAFGGYPSVPPVLAAAFSGVGTRIFLHEQNAVLGRANRFLAKYADVLLLSFAATAGLPAGVKTMVLGNPVRPAMIAAQGADYAPPGETIEIFVLGGSLGARVFGTLIPEALALLPEGLRARLRVTQQCRAQEQEAALRVYRDARIEVRLSPFFPDVDEKLRRAHLVIARAGASSVAEIAVVGRPAILIPLPNAIDDHQRANADALAAAGGAWRMDQADTTPRRLADRIESLLANPEMLVRAAAAAAAAGRADAAARVAAAVMGAEA